MTIETYTLSRIEAAYAVAVLYRALETPETSSEQDREIMAAIMMKLSAPMKLCQEARDCIEDQASTNK